MRILDGAVGTELARHGFALTAPEYAIAANRQAPEQVQALYQAYLDAGAQALTLNSFGLSQGLSLDAPNFRQDLSLRAQLAVSLARPFAVRAPIWGALSFGVQEDRSPRLLAEIQALLATGISRVRLETLCEIEALLDVQNELISTLVAAQAQLTLSLCPVKKCMTQLLSELETSPLLNYPGLQSLGINCVDRSTMKHAVRELSAWLCAQPRRSSLSIELRPHLSDHANRGAWQTYAVSWGALVPQMEDILHSLPAQLRAKTALGTCCGGGPKHIRALRLAFGQSP